MKKYSFNIANPFLKITSQSNVAVSPSRDGSVYIEISGSDKAIANISVKQQGDTIQIEDKSLGSSFSQTITSNGRTVVQSFSGNVSGVSMIDGDIHISGSSGSVFVNGKRVNFDQSQSPEECSKPTVIAIYTPMADVELELKGIAKFASSQDFGSVYADLSGSTQAVFTANSIDLDLSGSSNVRANINGGELSLDTSGSSTVNIVGDSACCKADTSGASKVATSGSCFGDYKANASGASRIQHKGFISGKARERVSGVATISI